MSLDPKQNSIPLLIFLAHWIQDSHGISGAEERAQHSLGRDAAAVGNCTEGAFGTQPSRGWSETLANGTGKDPKGKVSHQGCPSLCQDHREDFAVLI